MEIYEQDQRPGLFSVSLIESTPPTILRLLRESARLGEGFIVVQSTDGTVVGQSIESAEFIGFLSKQVDVYSFAGTGLASEELGRDSGDGERVNLNVTVPVNGVWTQTLAQWVESVRLPTGLLTGSVSGPAGTFSLSEAVLTVEHRRSVLDMVCNYFGVVWRIDGRTLNVGPRDTLYPSPRMIVTDQPGSQRGTVGLQPIAAQALNPTVDGSDRQSSWLGFGAPEFGSPISSIRQDIDGRGVKITGAYNDVTHWVDVPDMTAADLNAFLLRNVELHSMAREGFGIATRPGGRLRRFMPVGSRIFAWFPRAGIEDVTNPQPMNGSRAFPVERVLLAARWRLPKGHGVYLYRPADGQPWTRITPFVKFGDGSAELTVETDVDYRDSSDYSRFGKGELVERLASDSDFVGVVGHATAADANQTGITVQTDVTGVSTTFTAVAGRLYRISAEATVVPSTSAVVSITVTNASNIRFGASDASLASVAVIPVQWVGTLPAGSTTVKLRAEASAGTLTIYNLFQRNANLVVEDIGPA